MISEIIANQSNGLARIIWETFFMISLAILSYVWILSFRRINKVQISESTQDPDGSNSLHFISKVILIGLIINAILGGLFLIKLINFTLVANF